MTPQRIAVFETLGIGPGHSTAEQVYRDVSEKLPKISLRTVYQVLRELADLDELVMLDLGTGSVRYDLNLVPHHHLVCDDCGAVVDIAAGLADVRFAGVEDLGLKVTAAELVLRGTCPPCTTGGDDPGNESQQQPMQQLGDPHA